MSAPWLCIGDYNEILAYEEKDGCIPKPVHLMQDFQSTLLHCGLVAWWIWGMWGICLHGKMDRKWMRMYKRGLTGLALHLSGVNYSFIVDYHT